MRYIYFTKSLRGEDVAGMARFLEAAGLDGADLTVRPGYPVHPGNVTSALPGAVELFKNEGLSIPLVSAPTNMTDPNDLTTRRLFEACGENGVPAIKIGYFRYAGNFDKALAAAKRGLEGFAKLAEQTGVRACYHTHSGAFIGSNCAGQRLLLEGLDPHHIGSYVDTGHQTIGGAPFRMALDSVAHWFSLLAIKDMLWTKTEKGYRRSVVPVGTGIADWPEIAQALRERHYDGVVSLHAEYETHDLDERLKTAKMELAFLHKIFARG